MTDDIIMRLRIKGEELSADTRRALSGVEAEAEKAGFAAGEKLKVGILAGAAGLGFALKQSLDLARDLDATSKQLGVGVEALQEWRFAASKAGVAANELDVNVAALTRRVGEANSGNRDAQKSFAELGVGFKNVDGRARDTVATMLDVIEKLRAIKDPSERAQKGTELLGEEYRKLEPLVRSGADGIRAATTELRGMQAVLSEEEIRNLQETNAKFEQLKTILSVSVAQIVNENADSIRNLTQRLIEAGGAVVSFLDKYRNLSLLGGGAAIGGRLFGVPGALGGAAVGLGYGLYNPENTDGNSDVFFRTRKVAEARTALERKRRVAGSASYYAQEEAELRRQEELLRKAQMGSILGDVRGGALPGVGDVATPTVDAKPGRPRRASTRKSDAERADEKAIEAEKKLREEIQRTIAEQESSLRVEDLRAKGNWDAAAAGEARQRVLKQFPEAAALTVDELKKQFGLTRDLTEEEEKRYQAMIDSLDFLEKRNVDKAVDDSRGKREMEIAEERQREYEKQQEELQRQREDDVRDLADLYETLFSGGTGNIWKDFKRQGSRVLAEIAAQYTLAMVSGGPMPEIGQVAGSVLGRSPLGVLFGRTAANDNQVFAGSGLRPNAPGEFDQVFADVASGVWDEKMPVPKTGPNIPGGSLLDQAGVAIAAAGLTQALGIGKNNAGSSMGGMAGSMLGSALGGPVGAVIGSVLGSVVGGLIGGVFKKTKKASATIGGNGDGLSVLGIRGNSSSREEAAGTGANNVIDAIAEIAEALGADVDATRGSVSFGIRKKAFRVDPTGRGNTKTGNGAVDFGADEEAAVAFAIRDLITDGVLTGISAASQKILASGKDLEAAIEKAVLIESVPKLLRERLDPMGAALDKVDAKFKELAEALREGGASAEQIAEARQLWQLEREDTIKQIGEASAGLRDFLLSLKAGSDSPLSLRQQQAEAEAALAPYVAKIQAAQDARGEVERLKGAGASAEEIAKAEQAARIAAQGIDQDGFQSSAQLLLGISRSMDASGGNFFAQFDRIKALTGGAADLIDKATAQPGTASDPFAELTANNTTDLVNLMTDNNKLLQAVNDNLMAMGGFAGAFGWVAQRGNFA